MVRKTLSNTPAPTSVSGAAGLTMSMRACWLGVTVSSRLAGVTKLVAALLTYTCAEKVAAVTPAGMAMSW